MNNAPLISQAVYCFYRRLHERIFFRSVACAFMVAVFTLPYSAGATVVRMETNIGNIDVELYDDQAPKTVANFLRYAGRGYYNGVMIHRLATITNDGVSVIQGGGYKCCNTFGQFTPIPSDPPILNEFDPSRSNIRGTIAMAKSSNPDSASSQWFFNAANNSASLDNTNNSGGFTVFGSVLDPGMIVVDTITNLRILAFASPFNELPVRSSYDPGLGLQAVDLVIINRIPNVKSTSTNLGTLPTFASDVGMVVDTVGTYSQTAAVTLLTSFSSKQNESVQFNNGIHALMISGVMSPAGEIVTLYDGATIRPTRYYAYGKTPGNPTDHWYDFTFDGITGAEIKSNRIILHFVDGERGDNDLTVNNSVTHTGAQAVVISTLSTDAQSGGCSIASTPSQAIRGGDWVVVSLFLAFVALARRRVRR